MKEEDLQATIRSLEQRLGVKDDLPTLGQVVRWLGAKTPRGTLMLAVAFTVASVGLWVLSHAAINFGWVG